MPQKTCLGPSPQWTKCLWLPKYNFTLIICYTTTVTITINEFLINIRLNWIRWQSLCWYHRCQRWTLLLPRSILKQDLSNCFHYISFGCFTSCLILPPKGNTVFKTHFMKHESRGIACWDHSNLTGKCPSCVLMKETLGWTRKLQHTNVSRLSVRELCLQSMIEAHKYNESLNYFTCPDLLPCRGMLFLAAKGMRHSHAWELHVAARWQCSFYIIMLLSQRAENNVCKSCSLTGSLWSSKECL